MFTKNLFRENCVRGFVQLGAHWLPLVLVSLTAGWLTPSSLLAGEPPTDAPAAATADAQTQAATADKPAAEKAAAEKAAADKAANAPAVAAATGKSAAGKSTTGKSMAGKSMAGKPTAGDGMTTASTAKTSSKRRGTAGRLPSYYGTVVDDQQRAAIYEIRARVESQLQPLQQQIDAIRQTEQAEMEALLTAEQLQRIEALRAQRGKSAVPSVNKPSASKASMK